MNDTTLGIIAAAVPLIVIGFFALRRLRWIFAFVVALVAVGIGYLHTTGTIKEFGHKVRVSLPAGILPEHKKAEEAPAEGGAMKALPPPAEPAAPTPPPAAESTPTSPPAPAPETAPATPPAAESTPATPPATEPAPAAPTTPPAAPTPAPANP